MTAIFLLRNPEQDMPQWLWERPGEGRKRTTSVPMTPPPKTIAHAKTWADTV